MSCRELTFTPLSQYLRSRKRLVSTRAAFVPLPYPGLEQKTDSTRAKKRKKRKEKKRKEKTTDALWGVD